MKCPVCKDKDLEKVLLYSTEVDYCPSCLGVWLDKDELRKTKDEKDKDLKWVDVDLWEDKTKFEISPSVKACPVCAVPLYEVAYGDSDIKVDICDMCKGMFLERAEFKKITDYLKQKGQDEILNHYFKSLIEEAVEIFTGPDEFKEELGDFLAVLKLFDAKFTTQHPLITQVILSLPK